MAQQNQQPKQGSNVNAQRMKAEYEKRSINTRGIVIAVCVMIGIALADTFFVLDAFKLLFSMSPWAIQLSTGISVLAGVSFLGAGGFAIWAAKQNQ